MVKSLISGVAGIALLALLLVTLDTSGALAGAGAPATTMGSFRTPGPRAHAAGTLKITDTADMHYISGSGSLLHESGSASGTLPGSMKANCSIGATLTANFTIYASGGTITGRGTGTPHGSGTYESFAGTLVATGGTGRYAHAHGHAGFYGTFDRRNYDLTVQTTGKLSY
jgi:hypothetical protein